MKYDLKKLVSKLNSTCRLGMEAAAGLCVSQANYNVEVEHLCLKLLEAPNIDLQNILRYLNLYHILLLKLKILKNQPSLLLVEYSWSN